MDIGIKYTMKHEAAAERGPLFSTGLPFCFGDFIYLFCIIHYKTKKTLKKEKQGSEFT